MCIRDRIECADIRFGPGFNALTGETGAGKSIVIDSISAVLGERTSRDQMCIRDRRLAADCGKKLDQAEQAVVRLMKGADGAPEEEPMEVES